MWPMGLLFSLDTCVLTLFDFVLQFLPDTGVPSAESEVMSNILFSIDRILTFVFCRFVLGSQKTHDYMYYSYRHKVWEVGL